MKKLALDMVNSVSKTYGRQEGTACNGHFGCMCYHPLFCFNKFGDVELTLLRKGFFRGDAAFADSNIYECLKGEPFPRIGFIVTNLGRSKKYVVHFYNHRGTAE